MKEDWMLFEEITIIAALILGAVVFVRWLGKRVATARARDDGEAPF